MQVTIVLFGRLKQDVGERVLTLEWPHDSLTITELEQWLAGHYPALHPQLETLAYAVNDELVDRAFVLHHGDEAALLPPVSGG